MRFSRIFIHISNNSYKNISLESYKFLINSSMIRKFSSGIYAFLPLGHIILSRIISLIKSEMSILKVNEINLPILQSKDVWDISNRWNKYGNELFKIIDRNNNFFCISPTNEEVITKILKDFNLCFNDFPINFFQINSKFRDEIRPRFGLFRTKEFLMKDAYSFYTDKNDFIKFYEKIIISYKKIFSFLNLMFCITKSDSGNIGGNDNYEFNAIIKEGENKIVFCDSCKYISNLELSRINFNYNLVFNYLINNLNSLEVLKILKVKIFIFETSELNKIIILINEESKIEEYKVSFFIKLKISDLISFNKNYTFYYLNFDFFLFLSNFFSVKLDFSILGYEYLSFFYLEKEYIFNTFLFYNLDFFDFTKADLSSKCYNCNNTLHLLDTVEIGHVFDLGYCYSNVFNLSTFKNNKFSYIRMGCYGIGISRLLSVFLEQNICNNKIFWPKSIIPFKIYLLRLINNSFYNYFCDLLYCFFRKKKISIFYDDRLCTAGVKLYDSEFLSFPLTIIVGKRMLIDSFIEIRINLFKRVKIKIFNINKILKIINFIIYK